MEQDAKEIAEGKPDLTSLGLHTLTGPLGSVESWLFPPRTEEEGKAAVESAMLDPDVSEALSFMAPNGPESGDPVRLFTAGRHLASVTPTALSAEREAFLRNVGLMFVAISAERGHKNARGLLAMTIAARIDAYRNARGGSGINPYVVRLLERRVSDLLAKLDGAALDPCAHETSAPRWMFQATWQTASLEAYAAARSVPDVACWFAEATDEEYAADVLTGGGYPAEQFYKTAGELRRVPGCLKSLNSAEADAMVGLMFRAAACQGHRGAMLALAESILQDLARINRERPITDVELRYALAHGWFAAAQTDFCLRPDGDVVDDEGNPVIDRNFSFLSDDADRRIQGLSGPFGPYMIDIFASASAPVTATVPTKKGGLRRQTPHDGEGEPPPDQPVDADSVNVTTSEAVSTKMTDADRAAFTRLRKHHAASRADVRARLERWDGEESEADAEPPVMAPFHLVIGDGSTIPKEFVQRYAPLTRPMGLIETPRGAKLDAVRATLLGEFPWMGHAVDAVCDDLSMRVALGDTAFRLRPILLHGGPGTGKTRFVRRLGEECAVPVHVIAAAGASDNRALKGTAKGYSSAHPSGVLEFMIRAGAANPLFAVDEIDKTNQHQINGSLQHTLLDLTEVESARRWYDDCLCCDVDVSRASWIMTANDVGRICGPLLSRMRCIEVPSPEPRHFRAIMTGILADIATEHGVHPLLLPTLGDNEMTVLQGYFAKMLSVRKLAEKVSKLIGIRARFGAGDARAC